MSWRLQIKKMEGDIKNLKDNPQTTLLEGMHSVAYHGGLGRPLICPEGCLAGLNAEVLAEFYAENYTAPRIVLAAGEHACKGTGEPMDLRSGDKSARLGLVGLLFSSWAGYSSTLDKYWDSCGEEDAQCST